MKVKQGSYLKELVVKLYELRRMLKELEAQERSITNQLKSILDVVGGVEVEMEDGKYLVATLTPASTVRYSELLNTLISRYPELAAKVEELKPQFITHYQRVQVSLK